MTSEELSSDFYRRLGADGLAARTQAAWDELTVAALVELIPAGARVLDVACGYGRITVPLAAHGYQVEGFDLSPDLLAAARERGPEIAFTLGSMTNLPYADAGFDAVLCLWSAFNELLEEDEQLAALGELWRVLAPGGLMLVEGRPYTEPTEQEIASGERRGPDNRVEWGLVEGILNPHYRHDETSLGRLCRNVEIADFEAVTQPWGGRERLVLRARKL